MYFKKYILDFHINSIFICNYLEIKNLNLSDKEIKNLNLNKINSNDIFDSEVKYQVADKDIKFNFFIEKAIYKLFELVGVVDYNNIYIFIDKKYSKERTKYVRDFLIRMIY